ncbi:NAALAD [Mytilus edulis]|uniref:NAALAD n=1 Tax=Mytilus edulis TaxID=6550 RepID=A0A8S3QG02_MYTED|nr:NAALAD [Mytilus edulis]
MGQLVTILLKDGDPAIREELMNSIDANNIRQYLKLFLKQNRFLYHLKEKLVWSINYMSSSYQVQQATRHGAIGIIIYSDPADYSNNQTKDVYPHSIWLPPSGTQRGTVKKTDGDPLTPGYPATETAYRLGGKRSSMNLPTIPVHPIGYGIARELFDWGGEEYGLIGSNEWVEQFVKNLQTRSVAYVNVDIAVGGNIDVAGSGSDFAPFVQLAGVPICDISYSTKYHRVVAQVMAEVTRRLSEELLVPFVVTDFSLKLQQLVTLLENEYGQLLSTNNISMPELHNAANSFTKSTTSFQKFVDKLDMQNPYAIRMINDQMTLLEKAFLDPQGLPGRPFARHVLFAESSVNSYAGSSFPGLVDALFEIEKDPNQTQRWNVVKKHYSVILFTIESAASTLREVTKFMLVS